MDLPDKSNTAGVPPKKKVEAVVSSSKQVKRPATRRFFDFMFAESPKELLKNVARNVIVPRAKAGFEEAVGNFLGGMLWGDPSNRPLGANVVRGTVIRGGAVNYSQISTMGANPSMLQARAALPSGSGGGNYRDLAFGSVQEAELVLANMYDLLNQYRMVSIADLYEAANQPTSPSDEAFGWTSFDGARIVPQGGAYVLQLPRTTRL